MKRIRCACCDKKFKQTENHKKRYGNYCLKCNNKIVESLKNKSQKVSISITKGRVRE